jgi:3',5'-cyclic AMP phosphodiesterase CpdA
MKKLLFSVTALYLIIAFALPASAISLRVSENIHSIWEARRGQTDGYNFIVIGDTRDNDKVFLELLEKAKSYDPVFLVNVGDFVHSGSKEEYDHYAKTLTAYDVPLLNVAGNHDVKKGKGNFRAYVGEPNWYFDLGRYRFVALDNSTGVFTHDAVAFAKKHLAPDKDCSVFFHCPPPVDRWKVHAMSGTEKGWLDGEIMSCLKSAKSTTVFVGHLHLYDEMTIDGVSFVISGGGGAELNKKYGFGRPEHGFIVVHVVADGGVTHEWVALK